MSLISRAKEHVIAFDEAVDRRVDDLRGNPVLDRVMYAASEIGDWSLVWHLLAAAQGVRPGRDPMDAARVSAILGAESLLVNGVVKSAFRRVRPVWEDERPRPHRLRTPRSSSFPSGHASAALTAARVLSEDDPLRPVYYAVAAVVASSRVYVRIHHASDVLAGAALGIGLAAVAKRVWPRQPGS